MSADTSLFQGGIIIDQRDTAPAPQPEPQDEQLPPNPPAVFHLVDGTTFTVEAIDGWQYIEQGVFVQGRWSKSKSPVDAVIPYSRIALTVLDFDALREALGATAQN